MNRINLAALIVPCALGLALAGAPPEPARRARFSATDLFPPATEGLTIPGNGGGRDSRDDSGERARLLDLVLDYGRVTGLRICFNQETLNMLRQSESPNAEPIEVPAERVHATVQSLLSVSDYCVVPLTEEPPLLLAVQSMQQQAQRASLRQRALVLSEEELLFYREFSALIVTVPVHLPHLDVRQLATSLRPMMPDQSTSCMLNAGSADSLVLSGFATDLARFVELLHAIDAAEAERLANLPPETPAPAEEAAVDD